VSRLDREPTSVEGYRTERTEGVPLPLADSTTTINSDRLDESVTVAATLRSDSGGTTDDDATADDATTEVSDDGTADGGTTDTPDGEVSATADGSGPDADGSGPDADGRETTSS